jgi:hypothetical protein
MNLKKGTIYNTPLNPLSRGELLGEFSQEGSYKENPLSRGEFLGEFSQEGSYKENPLSRGELYQISVDMQQIYYMNKCLLKEIMV